MRLVTWSRALLGCALVFGACAVDSFGQPPGGQRQGGPGRGNFGGGRGGMITMLRLDEVRTELKVGDEEKGKLDALSEELQTASQAIREANGIAGRGGGGGGRGRDGAGGAGGGRGRDGAGGGRGPGGAGGGRGFGGPPTPEQIKANKEIAAKTKELEAKVSDILDPDQMKRVVGLLIQRDGARSLTVTAVADAVGITEDQKPKIQDAIDKGATQVQEKQQELFAAQDFQAIPEAITAAQLEADKLVTAVLTPEQTKKMDSLKGPAFVFPAPAFGRGGGQGGAGGAGGGRGRRGQGN